MADGSGQFRFDGITGGIYTLTVEKAGFEKSTRQITILPAIPNVLEIVLETGAIRETLTITDHYGYSVPVATSATKIPTLLRDIPQSIQVVSQELMQSQAALSMQDVLRNVSGVSLHLGEGRRDQVYIRGFSAVNDSFIDGVRDDAPYYRDLSNIEQIEVLKGPASALFGRGSSGGIVNRVTKKPDVERPIGEASVVTGSYGMKRTTGDLGRAVNDGKLAFRLIGAYEDSGSHRDFFGIERYTVAPSAVWRPSQNTQFLGQVEHLQDRRLPDRGIPSVNGIPADVRAGAYYGYPQDDFLKHRVTSESLTFDHRFSSGWTVRNIFRHTNYKTDFSTTAANGVRFVNGQTLVSRQQYNADQNQGNYFDQTEASTTGTLWGMRHTVLMGVEVGTQNTGMLRFNGTAPDVSLVNPVLTPPRYSATPAIDNAFHGGVFGLYLQDQISISTRWKALVGARRDRFRQTLDDRSSRNVDLGRTDQVWSPRAGLVYQPTGWMSIYSSYSRSFQPSGEGLSLAANNADLKPEITQNYEIGSKTDLLGGRMTATVAVFRLDRTNIKTTDPVDPNRLVLVGRQRTDGAEVSLSGSLRPRWNVYGGYAWLATKILRSNNVSTGVRLEGNRAGHIPLHSASLWSTYSFENGFGFGSGFIYAGDRFTSNDNLVVLPGYARVDATVFYRARRYEAAVNLRNLLNNRYFETAQGNFQIFPGAPVNGLLTLRYRW